MSGLPDPGGVFVPPDMGRPLPDHPLSAKMDLTDQELRTLLAMLPGPPDKYLLGRTLRVAEDGDYNRTDPRPMRLTVNVRYVYEDGNPMCYHFCPAKVIPERAAWDRNWTFPVYICPFYEDDYDNCTYKETMSQRHWRVTRRLPLVIPQKAQNFPRGVRPHYALRRPHLHGLAFVGALPQAPDVQRNPADYLHDPESDEDIEPGQALPNDPVSWARIDWDLRAEELMQFFRSADGFPFAAYFLRELLEEYQFLADDVHQALLTELKDLGKRPPGMPDWPRPNNDYWKRRLQQFSDFMGTSNPEPMFEQRQAIPKQFLVTQFLLMKPLQDANAHMNINWQKALYIVEHRIAVTDRFFERTNFRSDRMTEGQFQDAKVVMEQIAPSSARRDRTRAEKEARGEVGPLRQPPANYPGLAPANQHFPGRRGRGSA
ncbi:hypothetical protein CALCODRAFT_488281 [Calocera cornea HHB12733]|uniref:Uncharacterized protein n=1 Tax=Calocera cornea HHB12733 TaxID=1353952 RepID=A0A165CL24_9BASI|nr:hypothetical protein CALCODRAFT_488281 [Calocera cornea HHB12733]